METYTSIYQISDRSCQTSLELLDPYVDRALKKRRVPVNETTSLVDEKEFESTSNEQNPGDKSFSVNNVALGALGNFLFLPLIASNGNEQEEQTKQPENHEIKKSSQRSSLIKKSANIISRSLSRRSKKESSEEKETNQFKNNRINHVTEKIAETQTESDEFKNETIKLLDISIDSTLANPDGLLNKKFIRKDINNNQSSDCDSEFTLRMGQEDESLEEFKRIFVKNQNLVVNWDYVQTSDYL